MSAESGMAISSTARRRSEWYRRAAYLIAATGFFGLMVPVAIYSWHFHESNISDEPVDWGHMGEFVGGISGAVIALATLSALAYTLSLQAEELEDTRSALALQIDLAREQLNSLRQQLYDTRIYESRRIQPMLKAEWLPHPGLDFGFQWRIRNVGLGPGILDKVDIHVMGELVGSHDFQEISEATPIWQRAAELALASLVVGQKWGAPDVSMFPLHDLKRVLAANEPQATVLLKASGLDRDRVIGSLEASIRAVIHFRSLTG